jgi:hypothetical protein
MPRKVFTAGEVLAAADVNEFLQDQAVMTFAGTAARGSAIGIATEGMFTYLEDTDTYESYTGSAWVSALPMGAWTAFTPTWSGLVVGNGVYLRSHFTQMGKTVTVAVDFQLGSTSSVASPIGLILPATIARASVDNTGLAQSFLTDASAGKFFLAIPVTSTSESRQWLIRSTSGSPVEGPATNTAVPFTWATGDKITFGATYEAV